MTLRLYPQPGLFDPNVEDVRNATPVPVSSFYVRRPYYVAWSAEPSVFILETDEPDQPHEFTINRTSSTSFVPGESKYTVYLQLTKGANRIEVTTPTQKTVVTVAATAIESWFRTLGREVYLAVGKRQTDIENNLNTPWTTRISAHLIPYADLFLPARMPKIQQTRLALMTSMGERLGHGDGVRQVASAVSYSTPPVSRLHLSEFNEPGRTDFYPYVTTRPLRGDALGRVLDLWYPNHCLAAHQALFQMVLAMGGEDVPAPKPLSLVSKDDRQILLRYNGEGTEVHYIDPLSPECNDIEFNTSCDGDVRTWAQVISSLDIVMNSPQLPFDEVVESPLNFGFYDEGSFFDGSDGSGATGLGGGDDTHDTVDPDDPFGTGFAGFSLSRRFDAPACLDTSLQRGQRLVKFVAPLTSTTSLTPEPPILEGIAITVDADAGAPAPASGNTTLWATSAKNFMYEGDWIRFESPDTELQVVSAWPVLDDVAQIIKSDATVTFALSGTEKVLTGPLGFFTQIHKSMGVQVDATDLFSIVKVSDDGINSFATIAGNPVIPAAGPFIANVYRPLKDRLDTSEPVGSVLTALAGRNTYEIELSGPLLETLVTGDVVSYRAAPRSSGATGLASPTLSVMSDLLPLPGDLLYFDSSTSVFITSAIASGTHHTTGFTIYDIELDGVTPASYSDNDPLYVFRSDACWPNGDPVTPLRLLSLKPGAYLTP